MKWLILYILFYLVSPLYQDNDIKILSYNIHHGNPPQHPGEIHLQPLVDYLKEQKPNLVALQEVDLNTRRSGKINQAKIIAEGAGYEYQFYPAIDFDGGKYGLAILSRYPVMATDLHQLPGLSDYEPRILAVMQMRTPFGILNFANTHLDHRNETNRVQQMQAIDSILESYSTPTIIAGDFNASPGSRTIQILDSSFNRTCVQCPATYGEVDSRKAIDFIAVNKKSGISVINHRVDNQVRHSDHFPALATLKWEN